MSRPDAPAIARPRVLAPPPARHAALLAQLQGWVQCGWLRALDQSLAAFLAARAPDADPLLILAAALASHQLGRGHACLDVLAAVAQPHQVLGLPPADEPADPDTLAALLTQASPTQWLAALDHPVLVGTGPGDTPLVRVGPRLYLRHCWQHEQTVRAGIAARLAMPTEAAQAERQADVRRVLDTLFPQPALVPGPSTSTTLAADRAPSPAPAMDHQKLACALAARQGFAIVTGGPGTGKTTTVVRLLALLQHLALSGPGQRPLRIRLAAPTGKAAARLNEAIANAVSQLPLDQPAVRAAIPTLVVTVHRLLGNRPDSRRFRHDARTPLPLDVLVIDEASMLDLALMAAVLQALPPAARLILLGDKDQLASVEAGAVLGDLCHRADDGHYTPDTAAWLAAVTGQAVPAGLQSADGQPLDQAIAKLRHSHRFGHDSGIGRLAAAVNAGDPAEVAAVWADVPTGLARLPAGDAAAFQNWVVDGAGHAAGYRHYLGVMHRQRPAADAPPEAYDDWARQVLQAFGRFQLLCVLRRGPLGVDGLNARITTLLRAAGLIQPAPGAASGDWYLGRPVLVTRNDHGLKLMNGDVGIALLRPSASTDLGTGPGADTGAAQRLQLRVAFAAGDGQGGIRWLLPSRLRAVETVYAMTVHKSQGSEFDHAALVLPDRPNPVLTRELVYTAITRAKTHFTLVPAAEAPGLLADAVRQRVWRQGGLADQA